MATAVSLASFVMKKKKKKEKTSEMTISLYMDADWKAIAKITLLWKICAQLPLPSAGLCAQNLGFFFFPSPQEDYDYLRILRALRDVDVFQGMCHR